VPGVKRRTFRRQQRGIGKVTESEGKIQHEKGKPGRRKGGREGGRGIVWKKKDYAVA